MCVRVCLCVCVCVTASTQSFHSSTPLRFSNILSSKTIVSKIRTQTHTYTQHPLTLIDKHLVVSHARTHARYDNIQLYSTLDRGTEESVSSLRLTAAGGVLRTQKLYKVPPSPPPPPHTHTHTHSKHCFTTSFLQGRCQKAVLGVWVLPCVRAHTCTHVRPTPPPPPHTHNDCSRNWGLCSARVSIEYRV